MPVSNAQKKATIKYKSSHYERIELRLHNGGRELIKAKAASEGKSVNEYILGVLKREIPELN